MDDSDQRLPLGRDAALVLFDMLARAGADGSLRPADSAEQAALWELEAALERTLSEPSLPSYGALVEAARARLRESAGAEAPPSTAPVIFVDVDDTLVRSAGSKRIPMSHVIEQVRALHAAGVVLYCWSTGGDRYAHRSAIELGVADCFAGFLSKPNLLIDDQPPADWRGLVCLHPNEAASMSASDIVAAARGR
ncbi:Hypothetical protein A7982_10566 [Minicystis rosea]|nr:Hypothetical protein A7982_10566 [Minicystis rosea]